MPTNLLYHGPQNRIQKTSRNMAARKGPRLYSCGGMGHFARDCWNAVRSAQVGPSSSPSSTVNTGEWSHLTSVSQQQQGQDSQQSQVSQQPQSSPKSTQYANTNHQSIISVRRTTKVEHSAVRILLADAQCRHQSSEYYLRAGRPRKSNTVPLEYYWRARNADTNHQNTISGREDRESRTQYHQNTIRARSAIRILSAGGPPQWNTLQSDTISWRRDDDRSFNLNLKSQRPFEL